MPIGIVNSDKDEKEVTARIQPDEIDYYYPGFNSGSVIVNKSGNSFFTTLATEQIDEILLNYNKVSKNKFGILQIQTK